MKEKTIVAPESKKSRRVDVHALTEEQEQSIRDNVSSHKRALQKYEAKQEFIYPIERITQDKTVIRNVKFPGADEAYPHAHQALMRFCTSFYPNAKGGPIYVDEPKNDQEIHRAYERHKVMMKNKIRHLIVEKDTTYEHLLEQLGEF